MPHLIKRVSDLQESGPSIEVTVYPAAEIVSKIDLAKETMPRFNGVGLVDTGASHSSIDSSLVASLNLIARDQINILTPSGISTHFTYDLGIQLPKELGWKIFFIQVAACDLSRQPFDVLIGRDILKSCTLIFNGWDNSFQLHI